MKDKTSSLNIASQADKETSRLASLFVDAGASIGKMRNLQGAAGMPGPAEGAEEISDVSMVWRSANVKLVRTYDWVSRLDTVDNPTGLFPKWSADPNDPASYNFAATDSWVKQVQGIGAEIIFTIASAVPSNMLPTSDIVKYERVVENIVRHYVCGWGGGEFFNAVSHWEFGDQPDFGALHFSGSPDEFYEMYAAAARAVKRVDSQLKFGGPCTAFSFDQGGPYREGLLDFIKQNDLPLDFFTWLWFTDTSRDPLEFRTIATELRHVLDSTGFEKTALILAYWNMTGIPNAKFSDTDVAAFHAAAAVYMQDSVIDRAVLFRADTGKDLHYKITDVAGIFGPGGTQNAKTASFQLVGRTLAAQDRLAASGGDEAGLAVLAGHDEATGAIRVLISNYAIPEAYLEARQRDVFEFQVPVGSVRATMSLSVPPRRVEAKSAELSGYSLRIDNLPWGQDSYKIDRYKVDGTHIGEIVDSSTGQGGTVTVVGELAAPAVELVELTPIQD